MAKILIIEDDPYVRRFYDRLFHLNNYDVILAASGEEGIARAKTDKPSIILLDIMMPGMDGMATLTRLKSDPLTHDCTVVMLTNISDAETAKKAVQMGAAGVIIKADAPPEELLKMVDQYVSQQHKEE